MTHQALYNRRFKTSIGGIVQYIFLFFKFNYISKRCNVAAVVSYYV